MKNLIFLFLLLPALSYAQLDVNYDPITNTVSVNYTGCDICLLGNVSAVQTCECRDECSNVEPTEEDYERYDECIDRCHEDYGDYPVYEDYCLDGCEARLLSNERRCLEDCGPRPEPIREIIGFGYRLVAAWDVIPFDPRFDQSQWEVFDSETIESSTVLISDWNPPSPWPEIYDGNNTCYGIGIRIFYQDPDGSIGFCDFTEWNCNIIG